MALVTVQRSPSASNSPPSSEYGSSVHSLEEEPHNNRSLSEYYFAVKGFAVLLPKKECQQGRQRKSSVPTADIQCHLQAILHLLRPGDTLQMAVRLESFHTGRIRYLAVVATIGRQDTEESCLIGVDFSTSTPTIGLVLAVLADTMINLDGDGSALQTVHKECAKAREHHCYQGGLNHDWVGFYDKSVSSDQSCVNEWNAMDSLESKRPPSPDSLTNKEETELLIRSKLKEIMMSVDIDEVTSKYIRQRLEGDMKMDLFKFKSFIDQEMLTILGQMDAATEIFPHVYLGSEWNASNLEELKGNGVGFILNVTKEIDNFYPGMFDYLNIRVYDDEKTELLRHWDDTYKYISQVKEKGSKVLVHCKMGISRSASVVIAYAMKAHNLSLDDATELVKNKRNCIKPNQAFTSQLKVYQGILDASRQRHNALFRSKSETNLKSSATSNNQSNNTRFSYVPRGMQVMPIPDFKPRSNSSSVVTSKTGSDEANEGEGNKCHPSNELATLHVPSPLPGRRPRSWSPDEDTAKMLNLQPYEDSDFGESLQKSRSLNDQAWQAHVTVVQRDLRDPGGGVRMEETFVEAVNPLYVPRTTPSSPSSSQRLEELQLSSSVKERINEFESSKNVCAKTGSTTTTTTTTTTNNNNNNNDNKSPGSSQTNKKSPLTITLDNVTTTSSTDFNTPEEGDANELEVVTETQLCSSSPEPENKEPVVSQTKAFPQKHQAIIVPSQICIEEHVLCDEGVSDANETSDSAAGVHDEPIIWPAGIVKKQKEDFEEKVKLQEKPKGREQDGSDPILSRQGSSHSLNAVDSIRMASPAAEVGKKEDPFSLRVDRVFDREERKDKKQALSGGIFMNDKDSPSRNNSWGSFDSAVVLPDRETPSRQSSWGSCDTRLSGSSLLSRNSSFGAFDNKQTGGPIFVPETGGQNPLQINYVAYCVDKENLPIRRNKINIRGPNAGLLEECSSEDSAISRSVTNVKAYAPMPFKTQAEKETSTSSDPEDKTESPSSTPGTPSCRDFDTEAFHTLTRSQPDTNIFFQRAGVKRSLKTSPQTPEHEIPLPGTVRQQMQKLENKTRQFNKDSVIVLCDQVNNLMVPSIGRSLSSGCVCSSNQRERKGQITRSSSEKRAKTDYEGSKGNVKKITKALEIQSSEAAAPHLKMSRSLKQKGKRERPDLMPRSQSLERLGSACTSPPTPNKRLSAHPLHRELVSSQNFLDQLVVETQAQVDQLQQAQEEITVKNLVDLFEDGKPDKKQQRLPLQDFQNFDCEIPPEYRFRQKKVRPRSESMGEKELPPVPQRKSSLDFTFRPGQKPSNLTTSLLLPSLQHNPNQSPNGKNSFHLLTNGIGVQKNPPNPPKLPPPQGSRACSLEVRRRKQQGKTHPLSKLTARESTL